MIKQWIRLKKKIYYYGIINTILKKKGKKFVKNTWWDDKYYVNGISDEKTIDKNDKSLLSTKYHYASIEMLILKHFRNEMVSMDSSMVMDIGSGSGHWIDFYQSLGAEKILGMDISKKTCGFLKKKYKSNENILINNGKAVDVINSLNQKYDIINAIGVMFHILDDKEWEETIYAMVEQLNENGLLIIGGYFGLIGSLNIQIDEEGNVNKRIRSKFHWKRILNKAGVKNIRVYNNHSYLWINDKLPENNILIATK